MRRRAQAAPVDKVHGNESQMPYFHHKLLFSFFIPYAVAQVCVLGIAFAVPVLHQLPCK